MKKALVCGAGRFIGGHMVKRLQSERYWVRGVDIKEHKFYALPAASEYLFRGFFVTSLIGSVRVLT